MLLKWRRNFDSNFGGKLNYTVAAMLFVIESTAPRLIKNPVSIGAVPWELNLEKS